MRPLDRFLTLGIESSCDDTSVAVLEGPRTILSWNISSQTERHAAFGGVVPEYASRMHLEAILPLTREALAEAGISDPAKELSLIAVTRGPGLMGSLLVGVMTAKAFAQAWNVPIVGVNHLEGHIFANVVDHEDLKFPFLCMVVSGGHTEIVLARASGDYQMLGATQDDAAGEAFDKVAKVLGLPYPGGPVIDRLAKQGSASAFHFPAVLPNIEGLNFSFSGLKTAAINQINHLRQKGDVPVEDFCASFQAAVVRNLITRLEQAVEQTGVRNVAISGGVAANSAFRDAVASHPGWNAFLPSKMFCTDNAVMVAAAGYAAFMRGERSDISMGPDPALDFGEDEVI
ncbi:MAG: tRNA (adenosine(37)-N6)-threonylcarbamoyltransferase complex transferase subunit TsaD [Pyramidobacter sp.]|nr:tRNA (adenosine(37)-N6)-threonylcarbamoyltransferase complex transferase subunit TsaD [Pyramidobacter sp.]